MNGKDLAGEMDAFLTKKNIKSLEAKRKEVNTGIVDPREMQRRQKRRREKDWFISKD